MKKRSGDGRDYDFSPSIILTSRYGHESRRLIHLIEKNLLIIMAIIVATVILSILNILGVLESFGIHEVDYIVDIILAVILVAVLVPLIILILKSRRTLDRWSEMFERNTIATTMSIAMNNRSKEEALLALSQSVRQISEPLQEYMNSKGKDWAQFLNVSVDGSLVFDVLLDANRVKDNNSNDNINNNLRRVLKEYGSIIIKIIDGNVDRQAVELFTDSLSRYNAITNNQIGLGLIIGENVTEDVRQYAIEYRGWKKRGEIDLLVLMAKPSSTTFPSPAHEPEQTSFQ